MKPSKGEDKLAGGSGTPVSRAAPRVGTGVRRRVRAKTQAAARPAVPAAAGAGVLAKERLRLRLNDLLAAEFAAFAKLSPMRRRLAARLGEKPEEIGRFLSSPDAAAEDAAPDQPSAPPEATAAAQASEPARRGGRACRVAGPSRKAAAPADAPTAAQAGRGAPAFLAAGTTVAIGATMVGAGIAALASVDVNPVAQVETV